MPFKMDALTQYIVDKAKRQLHLRRIVLFGSRARGDHQERSDYDIAFDLRTQSHWARFVLEVIEQAPTLKKLDLVNFVECSAALKESIEQEGIVLYEEKS